MVASGHTKNCADKLRLVDGQEMAGPLQDYRRKSLVECICGRYGSLVTRAVSWELPGGHYCLCRVACIDHWGRHKMQGCSIENAQEWLDKRMRDGLRNKKVALLRETLGTGTAKSVK